MLLLLTLLAFARSTAVGASRAGRIGARLPLAGGILFVASSSEALVSVCDGPSGAKVLLY